MAATHTRLQRSRLSAALFTALLMPAANLAMAQDSDAAQSGQRATDLDKVVVTGSLIPQTEVETFKPVTVISAEDIQARGFSTVADVLQQSSFATGSIQGSQFSAGFTQGAETVSLFGLNPGYTKYLIDGRPMANYPALYNGSDTFNNISGIPVDLVERIEILPGGQSSLYGSDAIAGVINVILKKNIEGTTIGIRGGTYTDGGGDSGRISLATGFSAAGDRLRGVFGAQYENVEPIWARQRDLTKQFFTEGTSPAVASRDWLVYSPFTSYNFLDPNNCENVKRAFGGTVDLRQRPGFGDELYCGSFYTPGYATLKNGRESLQLYTHATFDLTDSAQMYADALFSKEEIKYHIGSGFTWWGTSGTWGYYYDPNLDDFLNLQRAFAPEEMGTGGFEDTMQKDDSKSWHVTLGVAGQFGSSNWDYDVGLTSTRYELKEHSFARFTDAIDGYFIDHVLGPQLGLDPYYNAYPVFTPDYAAFYTMMSPEDFRSFTGYITNRSKTTDTTLRGQVTNASLFDMKGGSAGLALAAEYSQEEWDYNPDARLMSGDVWGQAATPGGGERDRWAVIGEMRLPVLEPLTLSLSGRHDRFSPDGAEAVSDTTYSLGIEYRPVDSLLFRGKYGTAFKAPTLADQFQEASGYFNTVVDYYSCSQLGYDPVSAPTDCPVQFSNRQFQGTTSGSTDLESLKADVWNVGVVWAPTAKFSVAVDYFNWDIRDEVGQQNANGLALREYYCRTGQPGYDINSPLCVDALSKVTRDSFGRIVEIYTPKVNEAQEVLEALNVELSYLQDIGRFGELLFRGTYTNTLKREFTSFEGDEPVDLLRSPDFSTDPKSKANASVTWRPNDRWSATLYANYIGHTPNNVAQLQGDYSGDLAGKMAPWKTYNFSLSHQVLPQLELSLAVSNLFDKEPPVDHTYGGVGVSQPYNIFQYNAYGRAVYVEARYQFGKN